MSAMSALASPSSTSQPRSRAPSAAERVFIDGVEQPRGSHQKRLGDRYRDLDESELPKAYDW